MKKLFTLLLVFWATLTQTTLAQTGTTCNAGFGFQVSGTVVYFSPALVGDSLISRHQWNFGDGSTVSNLPAPVHQYPNVSATYTVKHIFQRLSPNGAVTCSDTVTKIVTTTACNIHANFSFVRDSVQTGKVYFTNLSTPTANVNKVQWNFGDGSFSNERNPTHIYVVSGAYTVCLTAMDTVNNCADDTCKMVQVQLPSGCNLQAAFIWHADSLQQNKLYFSNTTVNYQPGDSIRWTFGDGSSSTSVNPDHVYSQPGNYTVCLRVKKPTPAGGVPCVSEVCMPVTVVNTNPCNLQAYFTWHADSTTQQSNTIQFVNNSVNYQAGDSIRWTFGDGTASSGIANPTHTYAQPGSYTVCLRISRYTTPGTPPCVSEICKVVIIANPGCNVQAFFTSRPDTVLYNKIYFTNGSVNIQPGDSIRWTFGDGNTSADLNPTHIYGQPGVYTVCLRIKRVVPGSTTPCVREYCQSIVVTPPCNLNVNFSWTPDSGQVNKIRFTNLSTPVAAGDSIRWTFGDGTTSADLNPVHVYSQPGVYTVCLRIRKNSNAPNSSPCVREICKVVVVQAPPCTIEPRFTWRSDTANARKIYFTNTTTAPAGATAKWTFGDGSSATTWNATHEYAQTGRYIVCLTIQVNNTCVRSKCDTIVVATPPPACNQLANYSFVRLNNGGTAYQFFPAYQNPAYTYTWTFGDGTGSQAMTPVHQFVQPGTYSVCLTVFRNTNCVATSCKLITVLPQLICDSVRVSYVSQRDPFMPNKVYFYAISNFPIMQQKWTITRVPSGAGTPSVVLYQNNPVYVFSDTGTYRVCLRAVTLGGCIKEYCQNISITQVPPQQCILSAYPNPTQNVVNVNVQLTQPQLINAYVYNAQNVLVKQKQQQGVAGGNVVSLNVGDLVPGFYTIKLVYGSKTCYAKFQKL